MTRTGNRSAGDRPAGGRAPAFAALSILAVALASVAATVQEPPPQAGPDPSELERYREKAAESDRPVDQYNLGTALLRRGETDAARQPLQLATGAERELVRRSGFYNFGVSSALHGRFENDDPMATRAELIQARDAFREVLRDTPDDADARWNLEVVERWLEEEEQNNPQGGEGSKGGDAESESGAGAGGSPTEGGGDQQQLSEDQAAQLLDQAGDAEASIRDRVMGRNRFRDPQVERNW